MYKPLIVVHHVPKTSGSTLRSRFMDNLGSDRVYWHVADGNILEDVGRLKKLGDRLLVVGGHMHFDVIERLSFDRDIIRFSMVRNPVSLLLSALNYVKKRTEHPHFTEISPDDPAILDTAFYRRYSQTQCHTMTSYVSADRAIERINANRYVVTTNDRVEELFQRAMDFLNEPIHQPIRLMNIGSNDFSWFDEPRARDILARGVGEDLKLYNYVADTCYGWLDTTK